MVGALTTGEVSGDQLVRYSIDRGLLGAIHYGKESVELYRELYRIRNSCVAEIRFRLRGQIKLTGQNPKTDRFLPIFNKSRPMQGNRGSSRSDRSTPTRRRRQSIRLLSEF